LEEQAGEFVIDYKNDERVPLSETHRYRVRFPPLNSEEETRNYNSLRHYLLEISRKDSEMI